MACWETTVTLERPFDPSQIYMSSKARDQWSRILLCVMLPVSYFLISLLLFGGLLLFLGGLGSTLPVPWGPAFEVQVSSISRGVAILFKFDLCSVLGCFPFHWIFCRVAAATECCCEKNMYVLISHHIYIYTCIYIYTVLWSINVIVLHGLGHWRGLCDAGVCYCQPGFSGRWGWVDNLTIWQL